MSKAAGAPAQRTFLLGSGKIEYAELDPSRCKCATFLAACRAEELALATPPEAGGASTARGGTMGDLIDYGVRRVTDALQRIGCKSGALPFSDPDADGYCIDWLRRKLVAARVQQQGLHTCDWGAVDKATLSSMCADARSNLASIPDEWTAAKISCFFSGRPDWGVFAGAFPCLWGEVADKQSTTQKTRAEALALVQSPVFRNVVEKFRTKHGIAPHPAVEFQLAVAEGKEVEEQEVSPRASTPRARKLARTTERTSATSADD